ncbi:MAG: DUF488 domain-containing protein [Desulfarculaceae bacterium]|nr:DUF488 domain-containing protein [Desulfarculaceae bacterium]
MAIKLFTIGFTKRTAENFFYTLKQAGVKKVIDIRLNNNSQLAGFTKEKDLTFFLKEIGGIDYEHDTRLAPTKEILDAFKKKGGDWKIYERDFTDLLKKRKVENSLNSADLDNSCLLCSEPTPDHCHRRLVAEYLKDNWDEVEIKHLS